MGPSAEGELEVAVIGTPDERLGESVNAGVVADGIVSEDDIEARCRERLTDSKSPRIEFVGELPKTFTRMIDEVSLREEFCRPVTGESVLARIVDPLCASSRFGDWRRTPNACGTTHGALSDWREFITDPTRLRQDCPTGRPRARR